MMSRYQDGQIGEKIAHEFLLEKGLSLLARNFRYRHGEIDLVMMDGEILVFIEVKYRRSAMFMHPLESIDQKKCVRLGRTGEYFIQKNNLYRLSCRFDIVSIVDGLGEPVKIEWFKNAFEV